jgi:hypothetical protein
MHKVEDYKIEAGDLITEINKHSRLSLKTFIYLKKVKL